MMHRVAPLLLSILAVVALIAVISVSGCGKGTPVAPNGSILAISASPTQIPLNGTATITVIGRKPDGQPLNPGTEIRLNATNGSIQAIVTTDSSGTATAVFRSNGIPGTATITAATGTGGSSGGTTTSDGTGSTAGSLTASVSIQVGIPTGSKPTLLLSVDPSVIPVVAGVASVTVIARNADGSPAASQNVLVTTNLGELGSSQRPSVNITTGSDGRAITQLHAGSQSGMATVSAIIGSSDAATAMVDIRDVTLSFQANPASISRPVDDSPANQATITLTASVTDFNRMPVAGILVTFQTTRGTLSNNGPIATMSDGTAKVTVTIKRSDLATTDTSFQVSASIPSGSGNTISQTATITVTN
jgi:hypothetical protein